MKLINKSALVAEIARQEAQWRICKSSEAKYRREMLDDISSFLDTLEVKEVDLEHLEQEVKDFCYKYDDRKEKWYELCPNDRKLLYNPTWANFAMSIAKHFFELGLKASQKGEKV